MAVTDQKPVVQLGWVDPREDQPVERLEVRADAGAPIDPAKIELIYDRPSDTLYLLLFGRKRSSVVVGDHDYFSYLADPETGEFLGVHIEDFLAFAAVEQPQLLEALEIADLRGITREQARSERHKLLGYRGRLVAWMRRSLWKLRLRTRSRKEAIVGELFSQSTLGIPIGFVASSA